jgi:hypothetical protein
MELMTDTCSYVSHLRSIALETIVKRFGAIRDPKDKNKWLTHHGPVSITGLKFFNWKHNRGGGGAIDLVMHLADCDFIDAVFWLRNTVAPIPTTKSNSSEDKKGNTLLLPQRDDSHLSRILYYLTKKRALSETVVRQLIEKGMIYADKKANAVFCMRGKNRAIVGAELRGTSTSKWRGMAKGSNKNQGCFYIHTPNTKKMILCESAIDALSYFSLDNQWSALSTAGARHNPPWLARFAEKGFDIYCGFDADETGDKMAQKMIKTYPTIKRRRPTSHDWNDVLVNSKLKC